MEDIDGAIFFVKQTQSLKENEIIVIINFIILKVLYQILRIILALNFNEAECGQTIGIISGRSYLKAKAVT